MTYSELVDRCGNERQAHYLATRLRYQDMSEQELEDEIIRLMLRVKERQLGRPNITLEYVNGERRDKRREMFK
jgi:hypothetical protein